MEWGEIWNKVDCQRSEIRMKTQKVRKNNNKQNKTKQNTYLNNTVMHIFGVDPFLIANNYSANERKALRFWLSSFAESKTYNE